MEHSWIENDFVNAVCSLLYKPTQIVWAGDYADNEEGEEANLHSIAYDKYLKVEPLPMTLPKYLLNESKKEFVDFTTLPEGEDGWIIHPLPLLTCEGNGRGSGDYRGDCRHVGAWARDFIYLSGILPDDFNELKPDFVE